MSRYAKISSRAIHRTFPRGERRNGSFGPAICNAVSTNSRLASEASSVGLAAAIAANNTTMMTSCGRTHFIQRSVCSREAISSAIVPQLKYSLMSNPAVGRDPEATGAAPNSSFGDILSQFEQSHASPADSRGEGRAGTVIAVSGESVFVDIGMKIEGILPASEFRDKDGKIDIHTGDQVRVGITGRNEEGYY